MTLRVSELFEESIRAVISSFKKGEKKKKDSSPKNSNRRTSRRNNGNVPSTSQNQHSDNDDDDDDNSYGRKLNGQRTRTRNVQQSNGVSSSRDSQAGPTSRSRRNARIPSSNDEEDSESTESSSDSSGSSDESSGIPLAELGKATNKVNRRQPTKKQSRGTVSSSSQKKPSRSSKRAKVESDEEISEESEVSNEPKSRVRRGGATTRRTQTTSDDHSDHRSQTSDDPLCVHKRPTRRPKRYESDQSFHVERPANRRRAIVESEDSDKPRTATRESTRKKFLEWAVTSEDDNDDDDDEEKPQTSTAPESPVRRSNRKKKIIRSDTDHSDQSEKKPLLSRRSTRARISQSQESESDHHTDQPSTSTSRRANRLTNGTTPSQPSISTVALPRTTRSALVQSSRNDHNYGESAHSSSSSVQHHQQQPSQSQPVRQTRSTIVSRHQRNADELDRSNIEETISNNRLLRLRSANQRTAPTSNFEALNGIRRTARTRTTHNYFEDENENEEEEPVVQQVQNRVERRVGDRSTRQQEHISSRHRSESDSYSEEDKTPLKLMASSSTRARNTRNNPTTSSSSAVNRIKRNLYSDDAGSDQVK